jgi:hypothetical protein
MINVVTDLIYYKLSNFIILITVYIRKELIK